MNDIAHVIGLNTVHAVVSYFYDRVQRHPSLSQPFSIVPDWPHHKAHLAHFWWVTLGGKRYREEPYRVGEKHALAGFTPALLEDWLALFRQTLDSHLAPEQAKQWYARAQHIGRSLIAMHEFRGHKNAGSEARIACR